ncbi:MAG: hypothetical protein ACRC7O_00425, partial [Fimbriiglobus sp.]
MFRNFIFTAVATGCLLAPAVGCRHACKNRGRSSGDLPPPPGGGPFLDAPFAPSDDRGSLPPPFPTPGGADDRIPPTRVPTTPGGREFLPPSVVPDSRGSLRIDPSALPDSSMPAAAVPRVTPRSVPSHQELLLPDPLPGGAPADFSLESSGIPQPPQPTRGFLEEPIRPYAAAKPPTPEPLPAGSDDRPLPLGDTPPVPLRAAGLPVGVPGYAAVGDKPGLFVGRRPTVDGFDALKSAGIRTVIYLHGSDADVSPAKELAERRGLRFEPVAVSPERLGNATSTFNPLVADKSLRPAFVSDDTGARAGILWFLYFRTVDLMNDDAARVRATPLGLRDAGTDDMAKYWL